MVHDVQEDEWIDLSGMTQRDLLAVAEKGGAFLYEEMYEALESAPWLEKLDIDQRIYREEVLEFVVFKLGLKTLMEFITERGRGSFTLSEIVEWQVQETSEYLKTY